MQRLEDYMYQNDLSEDDVINTLKALKNSSVSENKFYFEIDDDQAYFETNEGFKLELVEFNQEEGYIKLRAIK